MRLFDIEKYELPTVDQLDWKETKKTVGVFLSAYKIARERVGLPALPKLTNGYFFNNEEMRRVQENEALNDYENYRAEFLRLNQLFILGYSSIMNPYRPEVTERSRSVFMLRYVYGLSVPLISERINYQKNIVIDDSKQSMIQFSQAINLLVPKDNPP